MTEPDPHSLRQIYANGLGRHMSASCTAAPTVSGAWMTVQCAACGMLSAISMQAEQYLWFSWCSVLFHCLRDFLVPRPYITDVSFHLCSDLVTAFIHYFPTSKLLILSSSTVELALICLTAAINCTNSHLSTDVSFATAIDMFCSVGHICYLM